MFFFSLQEKENTSFSMAKAIEFVNPRNTSKKCSCCGNIKEDLTLKHRRYECDKCGLIIRRDYNACLNIKAVWNEPLCEDR